MSPCPTARSFRRDRRPHRTPPAPNARPPAAGRRVSGGARPAPTLAGRIPGLLALLALLVVLAFPALAGTPGTLTVVVDGLESDRGTVAFALYASKATYLEEPLRKGRLEVVRGEDGEHTSRWVLEELPAGDYALSLYHDEDGDGELDKAAFGIPREPYGFSNDARSTTGPPGWEKARFRFAGGDGEVRVRVR